MLGTSKVMLLILVINLVAGGTYAVAVQDTIADGAAVYRTDMILGYDVTGIIFDLDDKDPALIDSITFHIAPSGGAAKANRVVMQTQADGKWTACSLVDDVPPARVATCTFESLAVEDVTALNIVAR